MEEVRILRQDEDREYMGRIEENRLLKEEMIRKQGTFTETQIQQASIKDGVFDRTNTGQAMWFNNKLSDPIKEDERHLIGRLLLKTDLKRYFAIPSDLLAVLTHWYENLLEDPNIAEGEDVPCKLKTKETWLKESRFSEDLIKDVTSRIQKAKIKEDAEERYQQLLPFWRTLVRRIWVHTLVQIFLIRFYSGQMLEEVLRERERLYLTHVEPAMNTFELARKYAKKDRLMFMLEFTLTEPKEVFPKEDDQETANIEAEEKELERRFHELRLSTEQTDWSQLKGVGVSPAYSHIKSTPRPNRPTFEPPKTFGEKLDQVGSLTPADKKKVMELVRQELDATKEELLFCGTGATPKREMPELRPRRKSIRFADLSPGARGSPKMETGDFFDQYLPPRREQEDPGEFFSRRLGNPREKEDPGRFFKRYFDSKQEEEEARAEMREELHRRRRENLSSTRRSSSYGRENPHGYESGEYEELRRRFHLKDDDNLYGERMSGGSWQVRTTTKLDGTVVEEPFYVKDPSNMYNTLPNIQIPYFYGNTLEFRKWWEIFTISIDKNERVPVFMKLQLLMKHLKEDAYGKAAGLNYSPESYETLKTRLLEAYDHSDTAIVMLNEQMRNLKKIPSDKYQDVSKFSQTVSNHILELLRHNDGAAFNAPMILTQVISRLTPTLADDYERDLHLEPPMSSLREVQFFLDWIRKKAERIKKREEADPDFKHPKMGVGVSCFYNFNKGLKEKGKKGKPTSKKESTSDSFVTSTTALATSSKAEPTKKKKKAPPSFQCHFCEGSHKTRNCTKTMEVNDRLDKAFASKLCLWCLGSGHRRKDCVNGKPCGKTNCKESHNTLLHGHRPIVKKKPDADQ